jgi:hypothetical protein
MKGHCYDFRQLKDHTTSPLPRARGGRTQIRVAGNPESAADAISAKAEAA